MADRKRKLMLKRGLRVRNRLKKISDGRRPRLSVFRSNKNISAQIIDDTKGITVASCFSQSLEAAAGSGVEIAAKVGSEIAQKAKKSGIEAVVFDRGPYLFHGRVKALADAARAGGLKF